LDKERITKIERHQKTVGQAVVPIGSSNGGNLILE
jgi:hypothetical protein